MSDDKTQQTPDHLTEAVDPEELELDREWHARQSHDDVNEDLVRSVGKQGVLMPVHARETDGDLMVFDGWQRVQAAREHDETLPVFVYEDLDDADALAKSLILNDGVRGYRKRVSDRDRAESLEALAGDAPTGRQMLGIDDEVAVLRRDLGDVYGVGNRTLVTLVDHFGDAASVRQASLVALQRVEGVGTGTAEAIRDYYRDLDNVEVSA